MAGAEVLGLLAELEHSLRSNPKEKITSEEELVFRNLKSSLVDTFLFSGLVSHLAVWRVTRQFSFAPRVLYSAGAAFLGGSWACKWVLRSCLDPIARADGSRMQKELANIMLAKHQEESLRRSFVSKYLCNVLYPEQVFVDSHPDKPVVRWRLRNSYQDDNGPSVEKVPVDESASTRPATSVQRKIEHEAKLDPPDMSSDPLGCILGYPAAATDEIHTVEGAAQSRKVARANRRMHKRQRARDRHLVRGSSSDGD